MPTLLLVLDGFGYRKEKDSNAILNADTSFFKDTYLKSIPLKANGDDVGLLPRQLSGSEVGHMTLGAGRIVDYVGSKWGRFILSDDFINSSVYKNLIDFNAKNKCSLHLIGLLSNGGIHSDISHLVALIDRLSTLDIVADIYLHIITDGRDMPARACLTLLEGIDLKNINIASVSGRYYAMDRDTNWDRTKKYYDMVVGDRGAVSDEIGINDGNKHILINYIRSQYDKDISDEFIEPILIDPNGAIKDNDSILFFNFRSDRMKQIVRCFLVNPDKSFDYFNKKHIKNLYVTTATKYYAEIPDDIVFIKQHPVENPLSEQLSKLGIRQLKLAETEKYAHVTKFFNGERFDPFKNEIWHMIPSPKVATYDLKPEMSVYEITNYLLSEYKKYDFILCNFANGDMVGHTGNFEVSMKAVHHLDVCVKKILDELLPVGYRVIITADHGNCDIMSGDFATTHTFSDVPLWIFKDHIDMNYTYDIVKKYNIKAITDIAKVILE